MIQSLYKCRATHVTSVYVKEDSEGKTVWEGDVEVFSIYAHPTAKYCYGWSYGEPAEFITILELPPVTDPHSAVKAGIMRQVNETRKGRNPQGPLGDEEIP